MLAAEDLTDEQRKFLNERKQMATKCARTSAPPHPSAPRCEPLRPAAPRCALLRLTLPLHPRTPLHPLHTPCALAGTRPKPRALSSLRPRSRTRRAFTRPSWAAWSWWRSLRRWCSSGSTRAAIEWRAGEPSLARVSVVSFFPSRLVHVYLTMRSIYDCNSQVIASRRTSSSSYALVRATLCMFATRRSRPQSCDHARRKPKSEI